VLIGEVARATGVTTKTLRYYEDEGLLHEPDRTPGGYRDYPAEVVARVEFIRHAQAAGLALRQIHAVLTIRDGGQAPCMHVAELVADRLADVERRLWELRETRAQLRQLEQRLAELDPAQCQPTSICSAIQPAGS
jgi:DNA-binding transcriptional MerR regulator